MRVTYIHQYFNTPDMPGGTRSYEMARRLARAGHEVDMVTSWRFEDESPPGTEDRGWYQSEVDGIRVHWVPIGYTNDMSYGRRLAAFAEFSVRASRRVASIPTDVVFATSTPLTVAIPGVRGARRRRVPFVFEIRDLWPSVPIAMGALRNPLMRWVALRLEAWAYENAARIVTVAPGMGEHVIEAGVPREHVTVIPNGSDLELYQAAQAKVGELRRAHAWLGDRPLVVHVGAMGVVNDVSYLARAAAAARDIDPEIRFVTVGSGREEADVADVARSLGVLGETFHMIGRVSKRESATWTAAAQVATVLVGPQVPQMHRRDLSPNKFFDALAAGTTVAYNYEGFSADIATEAGAGLPLPEDDPDAAGRLLAERMSDEAWLESTAEAAKRLAVERFDRDVLAADLQRVLESAVASRGDG